MKEENMAQKLEEGQLVLCTVTKIVGTSVFVKIEDHNAEGTITFMEIAPGRIRNIREYAFPGKKIVCKVLSIRPSHIELSFRRVKVSERNEFIENSKKERSYSAMLKTVIGETEFPELIAKIKSENNSLVEFIENAKEKPELLSKYLSKEGAQKISLIIKEKKIKETEITKRFSLSSKASNGIVLVKKAVKDASNLLGENENLAVSYIAAGKYMIKLKSKNLKQAGQQIRKMIEFLENFAKKNNCYFLEEKE